MKDCQVINVYYFTGRLMKGRRWIDVINKEVEAKEKVKVERETKSVSAETTFAQDTGESEALLETVSRLAPDEAVRATCARGEQLASAAVAADGRFTFDLPPDDVPAGRLLGVRWGRVWPFLRVVCGFRLG